ncbi:MAG: PAS domain S-box protein [Planctomycetales bacterium]|nr:PAS domain S-box protein [Planctomycetales bacterium]
MMTADSLQARVDEVAPTSDTTSTLDGAFDSTTLLVDWVQRSVDAADPTEFVAQAAADVARALGASHYGWGTWNESSRTLTERTGRVGQKASGDATVQTSIDELNCLTAQVLRTRKSAWIADLSELTFVDKRLASLGLRAAAAAPLTLDDRLLGTLCVYDKSPRGFDARQRSLVDAAANISSSVLARFRAESLVQRQEQWMQSLHDAMQEVMLVLSPDGAIAAVNTAFSAISGFDMAALQGRSIWNALILMEEIDHVKKHFARLSEGASTQRFESYILTRDGDQRRISWSITLVDGDDMSTPSIICTGVDITDRCAAIERAIQAESVASNARSLYEELRKQVDSGAEQLKSPAAAERLPQGVRHDRRARPRRSFQYLQRIAPQYGKALPPQSAFCERQCNDISSQGFSFVAPTEPDHQKVVVAFGVAPAVVYLLAEIRHSTPKTTDGRTQHIVGCRYLGRVSQID